MTFGLSMPSWKSYPAPSHNVRADRAEMTPMSGAVMTALAAILNGSPKARYM